MTTIANSAGAISPSFNHFARVDNRVYDDYASRLGLVAYGVYTSLARYADNVSRVCWPKQSTIAGRLGISRKSVNEGISRLVDAGLIEIVHRPGYSNVYKLLDTVGFHAPAGEGVTLLPTLPGDGVTLLPTIELNPAIPNYTQEQQQPPPVLEQAAPVEPVAVVVVSFDKQDTLETRQESTEKPVEVPEVSILAETLPLPKTTAEKLLERAPAQERRAIVETFHAAHAKRSILKPAAYLAALVQAVISGTFTPESVQQSRQAQEARRRKAAALAHSNAEMERRALERLGLAGSGGTGAGPCGAQARSGPDISGKVASLRAALRGGGSVRQV